MSKGKGSNSDSSRSRADKGSGSTGVGRSTPATGAVATRMQSAARNPAGASSTEGSAPEAQSASARNASWWGRRRDPRAPLTDELRRRYTELWADHVRAVLAAEARIAAADPVLAMLAARLRAGHLLHGSDLEWLGTDPVDAPRLLVCDMCGIAAPRADQELRLWGVDEGQGCHNCSGGHFADPADLDDPVPTLAERLADLRARLRTQPGADEPDEG